VPTGEDAFIRTMIPSSFAGAIVAIVSLASPVMT
jgi:hypothetical protein